MEPERIQLFLTNCIEQNNDKFKHIYKWFRNDFTFILTKDAIRRFTKLFK